MLVAFQPIPAAAVEEAHRITHRTLPLSRHAAERQQAGDATQVLGGVLHEVGGDEWSHRAGGSVEIPIQQSTTDIGERFPAIFHSGQQALFLFNHAADHNGISDGFATSPTRDGELGVRKASRIAYVLAAAESK
jgi:hypothetical protein